MRTREEIAAERRARREMQRAAALKKREEIADEIAARLEEEDVTAEIVNEYGRMIVKVSLTVKAEVVFTRKTKIRVNIVVSGRVRKGYTERQNKTLNYEGIVKALLTASYDEAGRMERVAVRQETRDRALEIIGTVNPPAHTTSVHMFGTKARAEFKVMIDLETETGIALLTALAEATREHAGGKI